MITTTTPLPVQMTLRPTRVSLQRSLRSNLNSHIAWFSRPFIKFYAATAIAIVGYRFLPETPKQLASPSLDPEAFDKLASDAKMPWLTRKIAGLMESRESLISRGDAYLDSSMRVSKEKILMDDAQRPEVPIRKNKL